MCVQYNELFIIFFTQLHKQCGKGAAHIAKILISLEMQTLTLFVY